MLAPLKHPISVAHADSQKSCTVDKRLHFLDPDFFKPIPTESGLSCTYPDEFYEAFSYNSGSSQHSELAMLVLEYMTSHDKARLPLFVGASDRYVKQVLPTIQEKLATKDTDDETLATKFHIINCARRFGYLTRSSGVFRGSVILNHVNLSGMDLRDAYLPRASLHAANLNGANLRGANLFSANLFETNLREINLSLANLCRINLSRADLSGANLSGADLRKANLRSTNLSGTDITGADLRGADLNSAVLSATILRKADLRGADFSKTNLLGIDLAKVGVRQWTNLNEAQLIEIDGEIVEIPEQTTKRSIYDKRAAAMR